MGLIWILHLCLCIAVVAVVGGVSDTAEATVLVRFDRAPPAHSRSSTAVFRYSVTALDGSGGCNNNGCSIHCKLDGQTLSSCPADNIVLKNLTVNQRHDFVISIDMGNGNSNSSSYSWFIDTTPPTAEISSKQSYTNARTVEIFVAFSEPCIGKGGLKCINSSNCDVIVNGPAHVDASSLHTIEPNSKYRMNVVFSQESIYARAIVKMADKMCTDKAGNQFTGSNGSMLVVHLDRRPVLVDLWTSVPSYELVIKGVPRTVIATNKTEDLKIFLDFSIPIMNVTEQILGALHVNVGNFIPSHGGNHGNRSFAFELKNISGTQIATVELEAASLVGRTGTPVSPVAPISFLYDSSKPGVGLSSSSSSVSKESNIAIIIEFTKPVFSFEASKVEVEGGSLTRFEELSRALYSLTVRAVSQDVSVIVPAGQAKDISGNPNLASNSINIKHVLTPSISIALHSFMTAGILVTSLAAALLSISSANLGAVGTLASGGTVFPDPSTNLHGMVGHMQVFVLADWILVSLPVEYSETTRGLRWLLPREKLPWKKKSSSMWPSNFYMSETEHEMEESHSSVGIPYSTRAYHSYLTTSSSNLQQGVPIPSVIYPKSGWLPGQQNLTMKNIPYGLPLRSNEYFTYFLRGEPLSASSVMRRMQTYTGWQDLEMNLFWLGVGGISLLVAHLVIYLFIRWRTQRSVPGILSMPRFELFLLILMLPCISQSAAFVIRGSTTRGVLTGTLLLAIPAGFILSVCLFLAIAIFYGSFVQYTEVNQAYDKEPWSAKLQHFFTGSPTHGRWLYREGLPSSFLPRFGILFENRRGPPVFVLLDQNDANNKSEWTESGIHGIGRMRALSSDCSNDENKASPSKRFFGYARSSYIIFDLVRRTSLGIIAGACTSGGFNQGLFALIITSAQFLYLFTLKPYISRGVNAVEGVSLLCEAGLFILSTSASGSSLAEENNLGFAMLGLLLLTYVSQIVNEWYAIIKILLRLSQPQDGSFKLGLKNAAKGLLIPFLPRSHWSRVTAGLSSHRKTGLDLVPASSAMNATVVPVVSPPGLSPELNTLSSTNGEAALGGKKAGEGKQVKGIKPEPKGEMKQLRKLARASFTGSPNYEEGSTSYGL